MTGMTFAGKTTLARAIQAATGIALIVPDAIADEKGWDISNGDLAPEQWQAMIDEAIRRATVLLRSGADVLFDTTATRRDRRDMFRRLGQENGATVRFIAVNISREEAYRRWEHNNQTHERFLVLPEEFEASAQGWEPPTPDEDTLIYQTGEDPDAWIARHFSRNPVESATE